MSEAPYSFIVRIADLPQTGTVFRLEPDAATRDRLARHIDVLAIHRLEAELSVRPVGEGARVTGGISADLQQMSVVSLEPFDTTIGEDVDVRFEPQADPEPTPDESAEDLERDPPDPLVDGQVDLGDLVTEFLSLGVDPYPRRPGEVFEAPAQDDDAPSPFAALAHLKDKL
ncbi:YceD family protein [Aquabacter spiritensis]|uniref:Uncharacterized metal-binding protein YceD (DUF177 family) n=1 Tax=Aquabacter spiritensis TaxID=933073 RepID=A0A4R3LPT0_9HYPH|nr:YceD family protein [Aquabacter spiritensis]TCT01549.1 uncharacterized metal-binding protein YceD (DUF177 family) [Aquabacter spiritensis]